MIQTGVRGVAARLSVAQQQVVRERRRQPRRPVPNRSAMIDWIDSAAARGSAASRIGRPTTM
jgi:hypothetical protein